MNKTTTKKQMDLSPDQNKKLAKMMKEAGMPISLKDKDFKLGARELDIRKLSDENYKQMMFRMTCHAITYAKNCHDDLIDILKVVMLLVKKSGYDNITKAIEELELSLRDEVTQPKTTEKN